MSIKKAKRIHLVLAIIGVLCAIGFFFNKWLLIGTFLLSGAAWFISFRYIRCPHCGKMLIRRSYAWDPAGVCPSCGKHVDEDTIID